MQIESHRPSITNKNINTSGNKSRITLNEDNDDDEVVNNNMSSNDDQDQI